MSQFSGMGGHQSSAGLTVEWLTPAPIIAALGGWESFDLDPCAPAFQPWPTARSKFTREDDGLKRRWRGRVYLNPPYRRPWIGRFLARMAEHNHGVALIFARTETKAFHNYVWNHASGLLFVAGRINFCRPDGSPVIDEEDGQKKNSGAPSVFCAYGARDLEILSACGLAGKFVPLQFQRSILAALVTGSWRDEVAAWLSAHGRTVKLDDLYLAFRNHPKTSSNKNYKAKIRQVLQNGAGKHVGVGEWAPA